MDEDPVFFHLSTTTHSSDMNDLGRSEMRVLLVSDIHSNIEALDAVFEASPPDTFDAIWCTGDITGYGPNPTECVNAFIHRSNWQVVMGNHDSVISEVSLPLGFNPHALSATKKNMEVIASDAAKWLSRLKHSINVASDILLVHGSPIDPDEYLLSLELAIPSLSLMAQRGVKLTLFGHTHFPAMYIYDRREDRYFEESISPDREMSIDLSADMYYLVNPGSVGQPRDSDPRASYMELQIDDRRIVMKNRRVCYRIASCQEKMRIQEYPEILINRLNVGY